MKKIFTTLFAFACMAHACAQSFPALVKTTAIKERLVGSRSRFSTNGNIVLRDTCRYKYSGTHGSSFNYTTLSYRSALTEPYFNPPFSYAFPLFPLEIASDSSVEIVYATATINPDTFKNFIAFHSSGLPDSFVHLDLRTGFPARTTIWFNSLGNFDFMKQDNQFARYLLYNGQSQLIGDSVAGFMRTGNYSYNMQGNVATAVQLSGNYDWLDYQYNSNNTLRTRTYYMSPDSSSWKKVGKDSFVTITTDITQHYALAWDDTLQVWVPVWSEQRHLDFNGAPDTVLQFQWANNSWLLSQMITLEYDSYDNPFRKTEYPANNGIILSNTYKQTHYYYELYNDNLIVTDNDLSRLLLYPNPTTGILNISLDAAFREPTVSIYSATGQLLITELLNGRRRQIDMNGLSPGNYWVVVNTEKGSASRQIEKK